MINSSERPSLVETKNGLSVYYKNKYLYSKYNPKASIEKMVASMNIPENVLFLFESPILGYGLLSLLDKLPKTSFILAVECDDELFKFSQKYIDIQSSQFSYIHSNSVSGVVKYVENIHGYKFKDVFVLHASGGVNLYHDYYKSIFEYSKQAIANHWVNRLTLIKMGHSYATNFFKNLNSILKLHKERNILDIKRLKTDKPILVIGAGPSLDGCRKFILENRNKVFILCVDAAVHSLLPDIVPDAVVILESQYWIDSAFVGIQKFNIPICADLTSSPRIFKMLRSTMFLYFTEYSNSKYIQTYKNSNLLPHCFPPMGSVGLTSMNISLQIRVYDSTPIFFTGLDFAWQGGFTHSNDSFMVKYIRSHHNRISPLQNGSYLFPLNLKKIDSNIFTTTVLENYKNSFDHAFGKVSNIYEINGIRNNDYCITYSQAKDIIEYYYKHNYESDLKYDEVCKLELSTSTQFHSDFNITKLKMTLYNQLNNLNKLRDCFIGRIKLSDGDIRSLIEKNDFLYIHFPDADLGVTLTNNFLNRVRIELEYFIKFIS